MSKRSNAITDNTDICEGVPILFDGSTSTGVGLTYEWTFSDPSVSQKQPVEKSFPYSGSDLFATYDATLEVTDAYGCVATTQNPVNIHENTLAGEVGTSTTQCYTGTPVILSYTPAPNTPTPVTYTWAPSGILGMGAEGSGMPCHTALAAVAPIPFV